jgi:hypothetical protein
MFGMLNIHRQYEAKLRGANTFIHYYIYGLRDQTNSCSSVFKCHDRQ